MHTRKLGTLTLGASLITFGVLFLINKFVPAVKYEILMMLWPLILIFLGIEVIVSYILNKEDHLKYDGVAIFLIIALTLFSISVAWVDFLLQHAPEHIWW